MLFIFADPSRCWTIFSFLMKKSQKVGWLLLWSQEVNTCKNIFKLMTLWKIIWIGWEFNPESTSCSVVSSDTISFIQCLTSTFASSERKDNIHGKSTSSSITGTLHRNWHTSEACSLEENCFTSKGKTCIPTASMLLHSTLPYDIKDHLS